MTADKGPKKETGEQDWHRHEVRSAASGYDELRREKRRPVTGLARVIPRARVILDAAEQDVHACTILDASDNGYRIVLTPAQPIESEFVLELSDGSRRWVRVRWASGGELGIETVRPKSKE